MVTSRPRRERKRAVDRADGRPTRVSISVAAVVARLPLGVASTLIG